MGHGSDILEIKIKDATYRTYYKISVRISEIDRIQQIVKDLEHFGINLTRISKRPKRFNVFGEMIEDEAEEENKQAASLIKNENIW